MPVTIAIESNWQPTELEWKLAYYQATDIGVHQKNDGRATPPAIPEGRVKVASANIKYLSAIMQQLVELRNEAESDELGTLRATKVAFDAACDLVTDAAILCAIERRQIPYAFASTDTQGGIRIEWRRPTETVQLVLPASPDREPYIYFEKPSGHGVSPATADQLASHLANIM